MRSFLKIFLATLVALIVFTLALFFAFSAIIGSATSPSKPAIGKDAVLVLDLNQQLDEQARNSPLNTLFDNPSNNVPGLYDVVRMIDYAKSDSSIKGIYIKADGNENGYAASEELRQALVAFKKSNKFIIAYGNVIPESSYYVATIADKIYCNPAGGVEWNGFSVDLVFLKGLLDKLEIKPEIFYAGKFKSATEPLRATQMTDANRLQTTIWLNDIYNNLLIRTAEARHSDTATLHNLANSGAVQTANDALKYNLVDGLKYDDELKADISKRLKKDADDDINFVSFGKYAKAVNFTKNGSGGKINIIYAQGDIVDGKGDRDQIGSDDFVKLIRKARLDDDVKAIVFRVNSPGGSAMASEAIWREIILAKKAKPVVVSMGDYAASGGYYISCAADSVFANETTITGSIGVFSVLANMKDFFNNKLGVTFDGVKTAPYADLGSISRPLTDPEKHFIQASIDTIYSTFKTRVADGRKKDTAYIDSIAQGRVWIGNRAIGIGLVDRTGTLQDAVNCAARMAKLTDYRTREYPEQKTWLEQLTDQSYSVEGQQKALVKEIGQQQYTLLQKAKQLSETINIPQARLPFYFEWR
ncbi:signal peptide peptidase SppA [Parafilimonas terrae]|jgi:protease-4|uniref:Protease-4 n=1 Tax=Parafilimonas terrae TaxID=1465490 RepID=A0A1I5U6G4_9BACT|nr:signal peptide peptidase SppA [Parafilimonas terrae]SFP90831.1 protease-4 [Parafilimonas terrae]